MNRAPLTAQNLDAEHVPTQTTEGHPHPSPREHRERSHLRRASDDRTQGRIWLAFYVGLGLLVFIGVAAGLGQRADRGEALPNTPPASR